MANYKLDQMSVNEIKVYVAELEAKIKVYETVIANSNFRAILNRPYDEDKPKYTRSYKGKKPYKSQDGATLKGINVIDPAIETIDNTEE